MRARASLRSLLMLAACAAGFGAPHAARADWTASGSFSYTNRLYASGGYTTPELRPVRGADVEVVDATTGQVLASGSTSETGAYSLEVADSQTRAVAVRALARSEYHPSYRLRVVDQTQGDAFYAMQTGTAAGHAPDADVDFGAAVAPSSVGAPAAANPMAMVFNIFDMGARMSDWAAAMSGAAPAATLTIEWSKTGGRATSFFGGTTLYLADDDGYDDPNILHEMGHFLETLYGSMSNPGGTHYIGDSSQDMRLSWSEGFATYVSNAILAHHGLPAPHLYFDRDGFASGGGSGFDYSLESANSGGGANERAVNAALWDVIDSAATPDDSAGEDDDPLALPAGSVWTVLSSFASNPPPVMTIEAFWDRWVALGLGSIPEMQTVFAQQKLDYRPDEFEPNHSAATAPELAIDGPFLTATLYAPQAPAAADDDFFRLSATGGASYEIEIGATMYGRPDPEIELLDGDTFEVLAAHDDILDPAPNQKSSGSANVASDQRARILWRAPETKDYFARVRKSRSGKALANRYGTYQIRARALPAGGPTLADLAPRRLAPGERYRVALRGTGFMAGAQASIEGSGASVTRTEWLDAAQAIAEIEVEAGAAPGARAVTLLNPNGESATLQGLLEIASDAAPQVLISEVDPSGGAFELVNTGTGAAALGGWTLRARRDGVADQTFSIPAGVTLAGGATLRISDAAGANTATELFTANAPNFRLISGWTGSMELKDASGQSQDYARFIDSPIHNAGTLSAGVLWLQTDAATPAAGFSLGRRLGGVRGATGGDWTPQAPSMPAGAAGRANLADRYEDNDRPEAAVLLPAGEHEGLTISLRPAGAPDDVDWFAFYLKAGEALAIEANAVQGDVDLDVSPPAAILAPLAEGRAAGPSESAAVSAQAGAQHGEGLYRIRIFSKAPGTSADYRLTLTLTASAPTATPTPTPTPTPSPSPTPTPTPTPSPTPTPTETPNPTPTPIPTPTPGPTPLPGPSPDPRVREPIVIDYADLDQAQPGAWVTLWGSGFGQARPISRVKIGGVTCPEVAVWSPNRIDFRVPEGAASGELRVSIGALASNPIPFAVAPGGRFIHVSANFGSGLDSENGTGIPARTIARALALAAPGDTIYIRKGIYRESLRLAAGGKPGAPVVIKGWPGESPVIEAPGDDAATGFEIAEPGLSSGGAGAGSVVLSGLEFRGFRTQIEARGGSDLRFYGLKLAGGEIGLRLRGARAGVIAQCEFAAAAEAGLKLEGCEDFMVLDSRFSSNSGAGMLADGACGSLLLRRCQAYGNTGDGFVLNASGAETAESASHSNGGAGFRLSGTGALVNAITLENGAEGIAMDGAGSAYEILNCTVAKSLGEAGISVANGSEALIRNSIVVGGDRPAIAFAAPPAAPAIDHVVVQVDSLAGGAAIRWGDSAGEPMIFDGQAINSSEFNLATGQPGAIIAVQDVAELFRDFAGGDLELIPLSAARNFSGAGAAPEIDFRRRVRAPGGPADAGAFELIVLSSAEPSAWRAYE